VDAYCWILREGSCVFETRPWLVISIPPFASILLVVHEDDRALITKLDDRLRISRQTQAQTTGIPSQSEICILQ
jgi:hypothetical protein